MDSSVYAQSTIIIIGTGQEKLKEIYQDLW